MENERPNEYHYVKLPKVHKVLLYVVIALVVGLLLGYNFASSKDSKDQKQTITVVGRGTMEVTPNEILMYANIDTIASTMDEAKKTNRKNIDEAKTALVNAGVSESSITISSYGNYDYPPTVYSDQSKPITYPPSGTGPYRESTTLTISLSSQEQAEKAIDALDNFSFVQMSGAPSYAVTNKSKYLSDLQGKAIEDARKQIERIAGLNNLRVSRMVSIKDMNTPDKNQKDPYYQDPYYDKIYLQPGEKKATITSLYEVQYEVTKGFSLF